MKKKALSLALALVMCLGLIVPAMAAPMVHDTGYYVNVKFPDVKGQETVRAGLKGSGKVEEYTMYTLDPSVTELTAEVTDGSGGSMITYFWAMYPAQREADGTFTYTTEDEILYSFSPIKLSKAAEKGGYWYLSFQHSTGPTTQYEMAGLMLNMGGQSTQPTTPPTIEVEKIPAKGTAKASTQTVTVDGKKVEFQMYAILDANGNGTNYIKLRDMAHILNGTKAQFSVGYSNQTGITATSGQPYQDTGSEMKTPFSGDRSYSGGGLKVQVNGKSVEMTAISLLDDQGNGYTYFKLRDLGKALGFNVGFSREQGVYIESDKPYVG